MRRRDDRQPDPRPAGPLSAIPRTLRTPGTLRALCMLGLLALAQLSMAPAAQAQSTLIGDLPRRADLGFRAGAQGAQLEVRAVTADSPAARAGLLEKDVIVAINGRNFPKPYVGNDLLRRLPGNVETTLSIQRGTERRELRFKPVTLPPEQLQAVDTEHGVLRLADGTRLRTLITRPKGAQGPLPAIFFTQWVSCDSVEINRPGTWLDVLRGVAERSGAMFIRVERSAGGDSEGPGCHELDYDTEIAHYREAFDQLVRAPQVDPSRVVIWGNSLGATVAPQVAQGKRVAGLIAAGGGALSYFERMLEFDRIGFERSGMPAAELDERMRRHAEFHTEYLLRGKTPEAIVREHPHLGEVWSRIRGTGDGVHYGRPLAYHQQAARKNILGAWAAANAPVLALYNEFDQFESARGHQVIAETVNRLRPGTGRYVEIPQMAHGYEVFATADAAAAGTRGAPAPELAVAEILAWLAEVVGIKPAA